MTYVHITGLCDSCRSSKWIKLDMPRRYINPKYALLTKEFKF